MEISFQVDTSLEVIHINIHVNLAQAMLGSALAWLRLS